MNNVSFSVRACRRPPHTDEPEAEVGALECALPFIPTEGTHLYFGSPVTLWDNQPNSSAEIRELDRIDGIEVEVGEGYFDVPNQTFRATATWFLEQDLSIETAMPALSRLQLDTKSSLHLGERNAESVHDEQSQSPDPMIYVSLMVLVSRRSYLEDVHSEPIETVDLYLPFLPPPGTTLYLGSLVPLDSEAQTVPESEKHPLAIGIMVEVQQGTYHVDDQFYRADAEWILPQDIEVNTALAALACLNLAKLFADQPSTES